MLFLNAALYWCKYLRFYLLTLRKQPIWHQTVDSFAVLFVMWEISKLSKNPIFGLEGWNKCYFSFTAARILSPKIWHKHNKSLDLIKPCFLFWSYSDYTSWMHKQRPNAKFGANRISVYQKTLIKASSAGLTLYTLHKHEAVELFFPRRGSPQALSWEDFVHFHLVWWC